MPSISATPHLSSQAIRQLVKERFNLEGELSDLPSYADLNRQLTKSDGTRYIVKIAHCNQSREALDFENLAMVKLAQNNLSLKTPTLVISRDGNLIESINDDYQRRCFLRVITCLDGKLWAETDTDTESCRYATSLGRGLAEVDRALKQISHPLSRRYLNWDMRHSHLVVRHHGQSINDSSGRKKIERILRDYEAQVVPRYAELPVQIIHNDANDYNLLVDPDRQRLSGLFDFGDMVESFRIAELAIAAAYAIMGKQDIEAFLTALLVAYHEEYPLTAAEIDVFVIMVKMRLAVSLSLSSYQHSITPENDYLLVSQKGAWQVLSQLEALDEIAFGLKMHHLLKLQADSLLHSDKEIIQYRHRHLSENLSLAYEHPIKIVRGKGAYLYDQKGQRYLDMVNNVCHVGHCHPDVVTAGQKQMALLNTNTRYLHDNIVTFSKKLLATMPETLSVCMLVNSGSEANELALRLARSHTGRKAMVVVQGGYHGNANACIDISPYKFDGPGGQGSPDWVKQTLVPDPFRGKYRGRTEAVGAQYAADVKRVIDDFEQSGQPVCAFICESIQGVGGQIIHPPGYLKAAYQFIRDAGGVCIADEVQVGMGRVGTHWWAFQTQGAIPDIVTIGKPLGNGHPMAAVVTTQAIANSFVTGMEYFNTFGGNPVSCAIGTAVIDVIEKENMQARALEVGNYLQTGLKNLQKQFPILGDVRGQGMFIGAEFIADPHSLEPANSQINYVIERLKAKGILLTTEGPFHNVLKIKPPLAFSVADADYFLLTLEKILAEDGALLA